MFGDYSVNRLDQIRVNDIVAVNRQNVITRRFFKGGAPCTVHSVIFLVYDLHPWILCGIFVADRSARICRAVVHGNNLEVAAGLGKNGIETFGKIFFAVINCYQHAVFRHAVTSS